MHSAVSKIFSGRQPKSVDALFVRKNPAYGRHQLCRPMRIVGPIQIWRGCMMYALICFILKSPFNKTRCDSPVMTHPLPAISRTLNRPPVMNNCTFSWYTWNKIQIQRSFAVRALSQVKWTNLTSSKLGFQCLYLLWSSFPSFTKDVMRVPGVG